MNVLMVHNAYARFSGEEYSVEAIARLLKQHGHCVSWFTKSSAGLADSLTKKLSAGFAGIFNLRTRAEVNQILEHDNFDIVQVQNLFPLLSPSVLKPVKERGIPVVMRCPNYRLFCPTGLHLSRGRPCKRCLGPGRELWCILRNCEGDLLKSTGYALRSAWTRIRGLVLRNVDMFIVLTDFQKQKFAEQGIAEDRIGIVPAFVSKVRIPEADTPSKSVTFIGRISSEKGVDEFLNAAKAMPNIRFAIAGSDRGMPGLWHGSPSNVKWLGFLREDELDELYLRSRIVVVPSRCYEGFPNVIVQAMLFGRPVVAARVGGIASIVEDNTTGLLFEAGNSKDLAIKIARLYDDEDLCQRLGSAAQTRAASKYSAARAYESLMDVYKRAAKHCYSSQ